MSRAVFGRFLNAMHICVELYLFVSHLMPQQSIVLTEDQPRHVCHRYHMLWSPDVETRCALPNSVPERPDVEHMHGADVSGEALHFALRASSASCF